MEKFTTLTAIAAPLLRINVDTDAIIPSREMKKVSKVGLSDGLFAGWRYREPGSRDENPDFILNQEPYRRAKVLLTGANFGCGSSRDTPSGRWPNGAYAPSSLRASVPSSRATACATASCPWC